MDLKTIKNKVVSKVKDTSQKAIDFSAKKLSSSKATIKTKEELEEIIKKSKNTKFINKETWEEKKFTKRSIIIFWDEKSDFFKDFLIKYPILAAKAFSKNIVLKLANSKIPWVDNKIYSIKKIPSLVVFQNTEVYKVIEWEENIEKLVKSFNLDINKEIDSL